MQRAYKAATKASIDELEALEGRIAEREANGEPPSETIEFMRQRIISNIEELGRNLKKFSVEGAIITEDGQLEAAKIANDATPSLVEAAAGRKPANVSLGSSWTALPNEQLQTFVGMAGDGSPLAELFATIPQVTTDAMQMALVQGISLGEGPRTVARRVRKAADIGRYRAETIARTEMIRSAREAQRQLYTENPSVKGFRRQATQDSRVCLACLALSGTLQATDTIMPSHPNCRCVMIPETLSWAEITGDDSIPDTRPPVATPERILDGLSDDDKLKIMGSKRYEMYLNGMKLQDMVDVVPNRDWGPNTRVKPLRDLGIDIKPTQPKPVVLKPKPVKPVEQPKPVAEPKPAPKAPKPVVEKQPAVVVPKTPTVVEVKPSIPTARTAESLRDRMREVRQKYKKVEEEYAALQPELDEIEAKLDVIQKPYLEGEDGGKYLFYSFTGKPGPWASHPDFESLNNRRNELRDKRQTLSDVIDSNKEKMADEIKQVMKSDNPIKIDFLERDSNISREQSIRSSGNGQNSEIPTQVEYERYKRGVVEAMAYIDDRPLQAVFPRPTNLNANQLVLATGRGRPNVGGWYSPTTNVLSINQNIGQGMVQPENLTIGHEFIHHLDMNDIRLRKATIDFYNKRTRYDTAVQTSVGIVKKDQWFRQYAGLVNPAPQLTGIEVPTVGMERMLEDPLGFAEGDFEYFKFMVENVLCASQP